jgi:phosphopantetheinyl transferase
MQSVISITRVGKKQILGRVSGRDAKGWLPDRHSANFITNPLLLDNATQLVLFHLFEHGQQANALLPFLVESLEIYADLNQFRGEVNVYAQLPAVTQRGTEANVQLITDDGTLLAQFDTICSRRIVLDPAWHHFVAHPRTLAFARELQDLTAPLPGVGLWSGVSMKADQLPDDDVTLLWCLDYVLHPGEIRYCERFFKNTPRRREWVLGRIAAKEAVKTLVARISAIELCPADIAIVTDENGRPWVSGEFINTLGWAPLISITHKGDAVLAVAAHPQVGLNIGVDMEETVARDQDFAVLALTDSEKSMASLAPPEKRDELIALLWAAKEAAAKASGLGLRNNPKSIEIRNATFNSEQVQATLLWISDTTFDTTLNVHIRRLNDCIVAIAALQPSPVMVAQGL